MKAGGCRKGVLKIPRGETLPATLDTSTLPTIMKGHSLLQNLVETSSSQ